MYKVLWNASSKSSRSFDGQGLVEGGEAVETGKEAAVIGRNSRIDMHEAVARAERSLLEERNANLLELLEAARVLRCPTCQWKYGEPKVGDDVPCGRSECDRLRAALKPFDKILR